MDQRLSVVTLGVGNMARSEAFYTRLGWRRANAHAEVAFFQLPGMVFALFSRDSLAADGNLPREGSGFGGIVLAYNARDRSEVDRVLAEAAAAGAAILKPAQDTFWGGYGGYFADPDGHPWEVAWNPEWTIEADGSMKLP